MELSPAMIHYVTTGRCPYCNTTILSQEYVASSKDAGFRFKDLRAVAEQYVRHPRSIKSISVNAPARRRFVRTMRELELEVLAPAGTKVEITADEHVRCLTCLNQWPIALTGPGTSLLPRRDQPTVSPRPSWSAPLQRGFPATPASQATPSPVKSINVANYQLLGVKDEQQTEAVLSETSKQYSNDSKVVTVTQEISITNSVTGTVVTEADNIRVSGTQTGFQILGFATIQGQIQHQLGQRYSVQTQNTLSISEKTTIQIPPLSTIEHIITWKMEYVKGNAILGRFLMTSVEVPYRIPRRLTYDTQVRDVPRTRKRSG